MEFKGLDARRDASKAFSPPARLLHIAQRPTVML
jgi:hypothetical protein